MQRWIDWVPFFAIKQYKIEGTINSYCTFILQKLKKTIFFLLPIPTVLVQDVCIIFLKSQIMSVAESEPVFFGVEREPEFESCCVSGSTLKDKKNSSKPQAKLFSFPFQYQADQNYQYLGRVLTCSCMKMGLKASTGGAGVCTTSNK